MSPVPSRGRRLTAATSLMLAITPALAQDPAPIKVPTIEQLAAYPRMTGFSLSPDGKHMLAIESQGDVRNILVWQTANLAAKPRVIGANNMRIQHAYPVGVVPEERHAGCHDDAAL